MKTFKFLSNTALVLSLVMLASCSSNDDFEETGYRKQKLEFKANIVLDDSTAATRVTLEDDYTVTWDENDQILVYCDNADEAVTFRSKNNHRFLRPDGSKRAELERRRWHRFFLLGFSRKRQIAQIASRSQNLRNHTKSVKYPDIAQLKSV